MGTPRVIHRQSMGWFLFSALAIAALAVACDDQGTPAENCNNGLDDDGDGLVDCRDLSCALQPECRNHGGDGGVGVDGGLVGDGSLPGTDGGNPTESGPPGAVPPIEQCSRNSDCRLAVALDDCCGRPREVDGQVEACLTAVNMIVAADDPCTTTWQFGLPVPTIPAECTVPEGCDPAQCAVCRPAARALCDNGRCRPETIEGCANDGECDEGQVCLDRDFDGTRECVNGSHECPLESNSVDSAYCLAQNSECGFCQCLDTDDDFLRDCVCYNSNDDAGVTNCPAP